MAATNISNLDGLDAVANIGAGGETLLKAAVKKVLKNLAENDPRLTDLFIGQMSAEGYALSNGVGLKAYVQSPTVKVEVWSEAAGQTLVRAYVLVSAAWVKVHEGGLIVTG